MHRIACLAGVAALLLLALPAHAAAKKPAAKAKPKPVLSPFQQEQAMSPAELIKRWHPLTAKASKRFGVPLIWLARLGTLYYFGYFWVLMPVIGLIETPKPLPASIAQSVLGDSATAPAE